MKVTKKQVIELGREPVNASNDSHTSRGLNKREYFAGLAMQAIISNQILYEEFKGWEGEEDFDCPQEYDCAAAAAVIYADTLLKQLSKKDYSI